MKTAIAIRFNDSDADYKKEIERRAKAMRISVTRYCTQVLINHVTSGAKLVLQDE